VRLPAWTALARATARSAAGGSACCCRCWASAARRCSGAATCCRTARCIAAGAALGADLALPPVLLAATLGERLGAGTGFGLFTLLGKLALALAGLALPLLAWLGYQPGAGGGASLVLAYAVLPCLLKLLAIAA
jgi:hypothetical protein